MQVRGVIDDSFDLPPLDELHATPSQVLVLDLDLALRITSQGIERWRQALHRLPPAYLGFVKVRPAILAQFNMVPDFAGSGHVISFYAPYRCPACGSSTEQLVDVRERYAELRAQRLPRIACQCHQAMELDEHPGVFLGHVAMRPCPTPPPQFDAIASGRENPVTVKKEVEGDWTYLWLSGTSARHGNLKRLLEGVGEQVLVVASELRGSGAPVLRLVCEALLEQNSTVCIARARPEAVDKLPHSPLRAKLLPLASLLVSASCPRGHAHEYEATSRAPSPGRCPECNEPCRTDEAHLLAQLAAESDVPAEAWAYLRTHPSGPARSGQVLGRFSLVRELGSGGMAKVHLARERGSTTERLVVVKQILPHLAGDQDFVRLFLEEARLAALVSHPNVVKVFDVGCAGDEYFMAMEYVNGLDLRSTLQRCTQQEKTVPVEVACLLAEAVGRGLHAAHTARDIDGKPVCIVHCDLSSDNVLVSCEGAIKVSDFGIARALGRTDSALLIRYGKTPYVAPELMRGASPDVRSDVYALGSLIYECFALHPPFSNTSRVALMNSVLSEPPEPLSSLRPDVPKSVEQAVHRALSKNPEDRFSSAAELADAVGLTGATDRALVGWLGELGLRDP